MTEDVYLLTTDNRDSEDREFQEQYTVVAVFTDRQLGLDSLAALLTNTYPFDDYRLRHFPVTGEPVLIHSELNLVVRIAPDGTLLRQGDGSTSYGTTAVYYRPAVTVPPAEPDADCIVQIRKGSGYTILQVNGRNHSRVHRVFNELTQQG